MSGSASPPDTSLTTEAPAASAARATAARYVSILTADAVGRQRLTTGTTRRSSSAAQPAPRPAGWTAADIDQIGSLVR